MRMKVHLAFLIFILVSVVLVSGCTGSRMEIGNVDKSTDDVRAMPPEPPTPTVDTSSNQTLTASEQTIISLVNLMIPFMVVTMVLTVFLQALKGRRRGW